MLVLAALVDPQCTPHLGFTIALPFNIGIIYIYIIVITIALPFYSLPFKWWNNWGRYGEGIGSLYQSMQDSFLSPYK